MCIKVEIGVGFFIVFGNYICNGNWVDFVIGFKNKESVYKLVKYKLILWLMSNLLNCLNKVLNLKLLVN